MPQVNWYPVAMPTQGAMTSVGEELGVGDWVVVMVRVTVEVTVPEGVLEVVTVPEGVLELEAVPEVEAVLEGVTLGVIVLEGVKLGDFVMEDVCVGVLETVLEVVPEGLGEV